MVTSKEQARQFVHEVRMLIMELPVFNEKVDAINTLLDLEWSLKELETEEEEEEDIWDNDLHGGIESPWSE